MTRMLSLAAFAIGALVILWMAEAVAVGHLLASVVMLLIALAYCTGGAELWRYQRVTAALRDALTDSNDTALEPWLARLPESLRNPVRQRIEGETVGLPSPVLTPYLVGLLVMLGLMGTFVGMVATLGGAVQALEGSTELSAIRDGLAAPIKGLGMAFGTSVAGVAASAMLGFIATLSRRDRLAVSRELDRQRDTRFRDYSLSHQRHLTYSALQQQADALPAVVTQLSVLSDRLGAMGEHLGQQLLDNQQHFQQRVQEDFHSLAESVADSLKTSLADSGRQAGETLKPVVEGLLTGLERDLQQRHRQLDDNAMARLEAMNVTMQESREAVDAAWQQGLEAQQQANRELAASLGQTLTRSAEHLAQGADASVAQLEHLQSATATQLAELGHTLETPLARLIDSASEAPRVAAELMEQLRGEMTRNSERDNRLLEERQALMQELATLTEELRSSSHAQRDAVEQILRHSGDSLEALNDQLAGSAQDLSGLGETFAAAVQQFGDSNGELLAALASVEQSLGESGERSDEQMAYYVAQAREIIDHNLVSHQAILSRLESLGDSTATAPETSKSQLEIAEA